MSDAMEVYRWQEQSRKHLTEARLEPVEMSDEERIAFLDEYEAMVSWKPASRLFPRIVTLTSDSFETTKGFTLREAVGLAAAKLQEASQ